MESLWSRSSWLMAFPIFSLLSLSTTHFSWVSSILISSHRATIVRFIPARPDAVYRCSQRRGSWSSPSPHGSVLLPPRRHELLRRGQGRCPDGRTSHRLLSGPSTSRY